MQDQLTTTQAARQTGIPARTLQAAIARDELRATPVGGNGVRQFYLIDPKHLATFVEAWTKRQAKRKEPGA